MGAVIRHTVTNLYWIAGSPLGEGGQVAEQHPNPEPGPSTRGEVGAGRRALRERRSGDVEVSPGSRACELAQKRRGPLGSTRAPRSGVLEVGDLAPHRVQELF